MIQPIRVSVPLLASILLVSCMAQSNRTARIEPWTPPADTNLDLNTFKAYLMTEGSSWILSQRERMRPTSAKLATEHTDSYAAYFEAETLDAVRYTLVDTIENPEFYDDLAARGIEKPLDFSQMVGIAFVDTIAISEQHLDTPDLTRLLFHECVHVAQYRLLGVEEFISQYVNGWANHGFDYFAIPLEVQAYELERRFARGEVFSVEDTVVRNPK